MMNAKLIKNIFEAKGLIQHKYSYLDDELAIELTGLVMEKIEKNDELESFSNEKIFYIAEVIFEYADEIISENLKFVEF